MILNLEPNGTLSMAGACGVTVEVLDGHLWVTQPGRSQDLILARGAHYDVEDDGVVLVGLEKRTRLDLSANRKPSLWRRLLRAWRQAAAAHADARELGALSDHRLRDLGLVRDQIASAVYNRFSR
ncbi:MAG: DUF1127 domain-containing protein [Burkholderiales bacterium]